MSSGLVHETHWKWGWALSIPVSIYTIAFDPAIGVPVLLGYGFGRYCTPDWDIVGMTNDEGNAINELKITGYILVTASTFYGIVFRKFHRSFITHFPVVSTSIRLIYLFWWIPFFFRYMEWPWLDWYWKVAVGFLIGLSIADAIHWAADTFLGDTQETLIKKGRNNGRIKGSKGKQYGRKEENTRKISKRRKAKTQGGWY